MNFLISVYQEDGPNIVHTGRSRSSEADTVWAIKADNLFLTMILKNNVCWIVKFQAWNSKKKMYREFSPNVNFITADFVTVVFQNFPDH